ncbi:cytochrome c-type biogenesis protein [Neptunomonas concharum]|uniref:Cytochrome c-type biogenesis protein n=1 Tax=Neptunomonas concharum TaxID=1031538 RepID=A0A5P1R850_9GAMM|nr:cytochrome c-type biogenesis protein [Neptunomonas concharum]QEQ95829.1 cytochrome c-type biogenesis protein CcmH [Neptunomonas concharum]
MRLLYSLLIVFFSLTAHAAIDTYEFKDDESRKRFQQLVDELRCPKCQNQNLADSNSPIAEDLRREVYRMVDNGEDDDTIVDFMVARYGEFVLYRPRMAENTWVLWYGPFVLLAVGFVVVLLITRKRKAAENETSSIGRLDQDQQSRLASLLEKGPKK